MLGTVDASARARMLREPKLDLKKAIDMCKNSEITNQQLRNLSNGKESAVNYVIHGKTKKKSKTPPAKPSGAEEEKKETLLRPCEYCGGKNPRNRKQCPAFGVTCSNCQKMHHFAKVCKQGKKPSNVNILVHDSSSDESVFTVEHTVGTVKALGEKWYATFHFRIGGEPPRSVS